MATIVNEARSVLMVSVVCEFKMTIFFQLQMMTIFSFAFSAVQQEAVPLC